MSKKGCKWNNCPNYATTYVDMGNRQVPACGGCKRGSMTPNPQAHTLDEQIRKAIKAYKIAGGDPEFYIISKSDHDRNWAQAVTEARIDELESMEVKRPHNSGEEICISFKGKSRKLRLTQLKENK